MKCHGCGKGVENPLFRGPFIFCSEECRKHSQDIGEALPETDETDVVFINDEPCVW